MRDPGSSGWSVVWSWKAGSLISDDKHRRGSETTRSSLARQLTLGERSRWLLLNWQRIIFFHKPHFIMDLLAGYGSNDESDARDKFQN